jgi:cytochrome c biogenesis protein ResB
MIGRLLISPFKQFFRFFSSLKAAIPLLILTIIVTIGGSLLPTPDFFKTWWYLGLLGLNGISLLFITIVHTPMILERKGRNALIGVVVTHMGILILIAGVIYGGMSGFRHEVKAIENEMTIVPGLPFVIHLDQLVIEEYPPGTFTVMNQENTFKKRQDSYISLFRQGEKWLELTAGPGTPAKVDGITILPSVNEIGWYFELIVTNPRGVSKTIAVKPWAPPIFSVGNTPVMAHSLMDSGELNAQVFTMKDMQMVPLGTVSREQSLEIDGSSISLGAIKRYTGLHIYDRPHGWVLVVGCLAMLFGLVWHFYFRHRDRGQKGKVKT